MRNESHTEFSRKLDVLASWLWFIALLIGLVALFIDPSGMRLSTVCVSYATWERSRRCVSLSSLKDANESVVLNAS